MIAAKKPSGKINTEMFDDVPVLQRKWQAALRPGEGLPRYEDVMLGSLGRLADHIALVKGDGALELSRRGRYVQKWLRGVRRGPAPMSTSAGRNTIFSMRSSPRPMTASCRCRPCATRTASRSTFRSC